MAPRDAKARPVPLAAAAAPADRPVAGPLVDARLEAAPRGGVPQAEDQLEDVPRVEGPLAEGRPRAGPWETDLPAAVRQVVVLLEGDLPVDGLARARHAASSATTSAARTVANDCKK